MQDLHREHPPKVQKSLSIEGVREALGLSKTEFAALLKVDPASLTRWSRAPSKVPLYILQSLEWYLELRELKTSVAPRAVAQDQSRELLISEASQETQKQIESIQKELRHWKQEAHQLKEEVSQTQSVGMGWKMALIAHTLFVLFYLLLKS